MYRDIIGTENFFSALFTLHKLLGNIVAFPSEPKYRRLNLTNPTISAMFAKSPAFHQFFAILKFRLVEKNQYLQLGQTDQPVENIMSLKAAIEEIESFGNKISKLV